MRTANKKRASAPKLTVIEGGPSAAAPTVTAAGSPIAALDAESKYQVLFDQATDAIMTVSADGTIDAMNQAAEEMTGFMRAELIGKPIQSLAPEKHHRVPNRARPIAHGIFASAGTYEDVALSRKDGYVRMVDLSVRIVTNGGTAPLALALFRDMTEKKRMERELITKHGELRNTYLELEKAHAELKSMQEILVQAGKMTALGELATGIAHELNQPLQGIRGYAQELKEFVNHTPEVDMSLREIISSVDKMAAIIDYLRAFTRKSVEKFEQADVHHAMEEALKMLARQFAARGIKVERDFGKNIPTVYANPLQLEQVFINLATNARDAIEATQRGHGTVHISTRLVDNKFVEIHFRDDGAGMSERTKAKAFNPFFTTKEVGKGMGLGLSLSYGMISKLHGSIVVESELGKGTGFLIRLPKDFRELGV